MYRKTKSRLLEDIEINNTKVCALIISNVLHVLVPVSMVWTFRTKRALTLMTLMISTFLFNPNSILMFTFYKSEHNPNTGRTQEGPGPPWGSNQESS